MICFICSVGWNCVCFVIGLVGCVGEFSCCIVTAVCCGGFVFSFAAIALLFNFDCFGLLVLLDLV